MHGHAHDHGVPSRVRSRRALATALALTLGFMAVEVIGGLATNSLALLSDAAHMFTDGLGLALGLFGVWVADQPATSRKTYGYHRAEILVALVNGGPTDARNIAILRAAAEVGALCVAVVNAAASPNVPAAHRLDVPAVPEWLAPLVHIVPLQLLTYYIALERGTNPDTAREHEPAHSRAKSHYEL